MCFRLKEETPVILFEKATKKLKHCGKPAEPGKRTIEVVEKFPASVMNVCLVDLPQEVSVKASEQSEDLKLTRRSKYRTKIFTMICCIVGNENDAWDLAQEGFLKAWRSIHRFEGRSSFYTWLYRITVNLAIDSLRRKAWRKEVELNDAIPSSLPGPGVNLERDEIREQINAALAQLSPEHRAVIVLKDLEGLQYREIAEVLNVSMGTVMSRVFYARKKLQSMLRGIYGCVATL